MALDTLPVRRPPYRESRQPPRRAPRSHPRGVTIDCFQRIAFHVNMVRDLSVNRGPNSYDHLYSRAAEWRQDDFTADDGIVSRAGSLRLCARVRFVAQSRGDPGT